MSSLRTPHPSARGAFTLVELLIVVSIVLILVAVAAPSFMEAKTRTQVSTARVRMEAMKQAMLDHRTDWGSVHADFNDPISVRIAFRVRSATDPVCALNSDQNFTTDGGLVFGLGLGFRQAFYANEMHCPLTTPVRYIDPSQTIDPFSDGTVPFGYDSRFVSDRIEYGIFASAGPDLSAGEWVRGAGPDGFALPYNPTNGLMSRGEYWGAVPGCDLSECTELLPNEYPIQEWFPSYDTDLDDSGTVDETDLLIFMQDWGKVSGP